MNEFWDKDELTIREVSKVTGMSESALFLPDVDYGCRISALRPESDLLEVINQQKAKGG